MSRLSITRPTTETSIAGRGVRAQVAGHRSAHLGEGVGARRGHRVGVDPDRRGSGRASPGAPASARAGGRARAPPPPRRGPAGSGRGRRPRARRRRSRGVVGVVRAPTESWRSTEWSGSPRRCRPRCRPAAGRRRTRSRGSAAASRAGTSRWSGRATPAASSGWPAAGAWRHSRATGPAPISAPRSNASRNIAKLSETGPTPKVVDSAARLATISSTRPLSADGVAPHQVQREPGPSPRHEAEEAAQRALGVACLDQHAVAVERVAEPAERHREARARRHRRRARSRGRAASAVKSASLRWRAGPPAWCSRVAAAGRPAAAPPSCRAGSGRRTRGR